MGQAVKDLMYIYIYSIYIYSLYSIYSMAIAIGMIGMSMFSRKNHSIITRPEVMKNFLKQCEIMCPDTADQT